MFNTIHFTKSEQQNFLLKRGFDLVNFEYTAWEQNGPYDNSGELVNQTIVCAVLPGETPNMSKEYSEVFRSEFRKKMIEVLMS